MHRLDDVKSVRELQQELNSSIEKQITELHQLQGTLAEMVNRTNRFQSINPFVPFQIEISETCLFISKNIGEINFWQQTGATIVGIKKGDELVLSPGPYATLSIGDTLYFVGNDATYSNVKQFLNS